MKHRTKLGIRANNSGIAGRGEDLRNAANNYLTDPVDLPLSLSLVDPANGTKIASDEIVVTIVGCSYRSADGKILMVDAKVVKGTTDGIRTISAEKEDDHAIVDVEILRNGDDLKMIVDTGLGDIAISQTNDDKDKIVILDDLSDILPRLALTTSLPVSTGSHTAWKDLTPTQP